MKTSIVISPKCVDSRHDKYAVLPGCASDATNLMERVDSLSPFVEDDSPIELPRSHRLVAIDKRDDCVNVITESEGQLRLYASAPTIDILSATLPCNIPLGEIRGEVIGNCSIGDFLTISCRTGIVNLHYDGGGVYTPVDVNSMIPIITFGDVEQITLTHPVEGKHFEKRYSEWGLPLVDGDVAGIRKSLANAYAATTCRARHSESWSQPIALRYAVRLYDDTLLFASPPVIAGEGLQGCNYVRFGTFNDTGGVAGYNDSQFSLNTFRVQATPIRGVAMPLAKLIKSVDIYCAELHDVIDTSSVSYRCESITGSAERILRARLDGISEHAALEYLANCDNWRLVHRIFDIASLNSSGNILIRNTGVFDSQIPASELKALHEASTNCTVTHIPADMTTYDGTLIHGGGYCVIKNPWDILGAMQGERSADPTHCYVALNIGDHKIVSTSFSPLFANRFSPIIAFPVKDAREAEISILRGGSVYKATFPLKQDASRSFSYFAAESFTPITIPTTPDSEYIVPAGSAKRATPRLLMKTARNNPLIATTTTEIADGNIIALAAALRPVSANIFGRYPVYLFTDNGVMAFNAEMSRQEYRRIFLINIPNKESVAQSDKGIFCSDGRKIMLIDGIVAKEIAELPEVNSLKTLKDLNHIKVVSNRSTLLMNLSGRYSTIQPISDDDTCIPISLTTHQILLSRTPAALDWDINVMTAGITLIVEGYSAKRGDKIMHREITLHGELRKPVHVSFPSAGVRSLRLRIAGTVSPDCEIGNIRLTTNGD